MNFVATTCFIFSLTAASFVNPAREDFLTQWNNYYQAKLFSEMVENLEQRPSILEWEGNDEQETSKESGEKGLADEMGGVSDVASHDNKTVSIVSDTSAAVAETGSQVVAEVETVAESFQEETEVVAESAPHYMVRHPDREYVLGYEVQDYLYGRLCESGIEWFMPYAMLIAFGESRFNVVAENANGRDKGLLQYRVEYVPWMDWRNPYQQIDYFVAQMTNRANAGCTVSDMISRHNVSDYGAYNQAYVDYIMSEQGNLIRIN